MNDTDNRITLNGDITLESRNDTGDSIKRTFTIINELGRGGSCIVYAVKHGTYETPGILKEFYPRDTTNMYWDIKRVNCNLVVGEACKDAFSRRMELFEEGCNKSR